MSTPKKFLYNRLAVLGSWEAEAAPKDVEETPASLLGSSSTRTLSAAAAAVLRQTQLSSAASGASEEKDDGPPPQDDAENGHQEDEDSEPGEADDFIALADSPTRQDAAPADDRPSYQERRAAQQAASERLAEHRKQQMPWMSDAMPHVSSPLLRLHTEITEFVKLVTPTKREKDDREAALERVRKLINSIWPSADLRVFGSYATDMYLPTSDIDCVVLSSGCTDIPAGLRALANASLRRGLAKNIQVISKATVPLFKYEDVETAVKIDISFDVANGPEAASYVLELMKKLPPMRPLVIVIKVFLQQRELNEVYSGGIGSYALLVMVASFLQLHPSRQQAGMQSSRKATGEIEGSLGVLLVDFFRLYGRTLNIDKVGVSCTNGGSFYNKRDRGFLQDNRPFMLSVEDPNDKENDLARNSYHVQLVRAAFDHAYHELTAPAERNESVLARIFRLDPVLMERQACGEEYSAEEGEAPVAEEEEVTAKKRKGGGDQEDNSGGKKQKTKEKKRQSGDD